MLPKRQINDGVITYLKDAPKAPNQEILIAFDRDLQNIGYLNFDVSEVREIENLAGKFELYLTYPSNGENVSVIKEGNYIAHPDADLNFQLYEVMRVTKALTGTTEYIRAECKHKKYELETEEIITTSLESATLEESAQSALAGTLWNVGYVFDSGTRTYGVKDVSPINFIRIIEQAYDVEPRYRIVLTGEQSIQQFVDFLPRRGTETGIDFEFRHNLQDIQIEVDTTDLVTALYGRGQGTEIDPETNDFEQLDFYDYVWQSSLGDPVDKPDNQGWIGDEEARGLYGKPDGQGGRKHIFGVYESQAQSQETLLMETWEQVQNRKEPRINIESTVADLEQATGYEHLKIRLGDTCRVKVPQFDVFLTARVIDIDRDKKNPTNTIVELGNFKPVFTDDIDRIRGSIRVSDASRAVHNRAGLFEPDIEQEGYYKLDKLLIGTDAEFSGSLTAATGTFTGDLSAAGGTFSGDLSAAGGSFTGAISGSSFTGGNIQLTAEEGQENVSGIKINSGTSGRYMLHSGTGWQMYRDNVLRMRSGLLGGIMFYDTNGDQATFISSFGLQDAVVVSADEGTFETLQVSGTKNCIQDTKDYGKRLMNAFETPDSRFIAYQEYTLEKGEHWIKIEPMFLQTISGYFVTTHLQSDGQIKILQREEGRFKVSADSRLEVVFGICGKRKGYEDIYMKEYIEKGSELDGA